MQVILIGNKDTKRSQYFIEAAKQYSVSVDILDYSELELLDKTYLHNKVVKIDPPVYQSESISEIQGIGETYKKVLRELADVPNVKYLNHPLAIESVFHKVACKEALQKAGIQTTPMIGMDISDFSRLKDIMCDQKLYQVFIKPIYGSGASGILSYRLNPRLGKEVLYTSANIMDDVLINTKKMRVYSKQEEIKEIMDRTFEYPVIVERWIPKSCLDGYGADFRVVFQFGKIDYIVGRLSKSPVTNLHLNNHAVDIEEFHLSEPVLEEIHNLCRNAMNVFPGLQSAGIDVLLTKHNEKPMIIEMNGQGDLIYKDIYNENKIYKKQVEEMIRLM